MMMNQNSEKARMMEENAQLRNRLIKKAETLGEYEFNATNRSNLPSVSRIRVVYLGKVSLSTNRTYTCTQDGGWFFFIV